MMSKKKSTTKQESQSDKEELIIKRILTYNGQEEVLEAKESDKR